MQLKPLTVYTSYNPSSEQNYRDFAVPPSFTVRNGTVNVFFSNGLVSTDDPEYNPLDPYGMQADENNPYGTGSWVLFPRFGYMSYSVVSGTPVVTVPTGIYKEVTE